MPIFRYIQPGSSHPPALSSSPLPPIHKFLWSTVQNHLQYWTKYQQHFQYTTILSTANEQWIPGGSGNTIQRGLYGTKMVSTLHCCVSYFGYRWGIGMEGSKASTALYCCFNFQPNKALTHLLLIHHRSSSRLRRHKRLPTLPCGNQDLWQALPPTLAAGSNLYDLLASFPCLATSLRATQHHDRHRLKSLLSSATRKLLKSLRRATDGWSSFVRQWSLLREAVKRGRILTRRS